MAEEVFKGYVFGFWGGLYILRTESTGRSLGKKEGGEEVRDGGRKSGVLCCEVSLHKCGDLGEFSGGVGGVVFKFGWMIGFLEGNEGRGCFVLAMWACRCARLVRKPRQFHCQM